MAKEYFDYKGLPLDSARTEIRLIRLDLTRDDHLPVSTPICTMKSFPLDQCPEYVPFSYVWGSGKKVTIKCNGVRLDVLPNLYNALEQYRSLIVTGIFSSDTWIWIDAICINQSDDDEKSWQIQLMGEIYNRGKLTWIWLGKADKSAREAMSLLFTLLHVKHEQQKTGDTREFFQISVDEREQLRLPMPIISSDYKSLSLLMSRPWFSRVWVIQELALSRDSIVQCGLLSMPWPSFFEAIQHGYKMRIPIYTTSYGYQSVFEMEAFRVMKQKNEPIGLLPLLMLGRDRQAMEKKDKIYALCGLADDVGQEALNIKPNYSESVSVEDEYRAAAKKILTRDPSLDLRSVPRIPRSSLKLPSWVPDWSVSEASSGIVLPGAPENVAYSHWATPKGLHSINFPEDGTICLSGHVVDRIEATSQKWTDEKALNTSFLSLWLKHIPREQAVLNDWETVCQLKVTNEYKFTKETLVDAYWQTLMAGNFKDDFEAFKQGYEKYDRFVRSIFRRIPSLILWWFGLLAIIPLAIALRRISMDSHDGLVGQIGPIMAFREAMTAAKGRRMFRTSNSFIGLAPALAQPGDEVVLVQGGKVPLILRRVRNSKKWSLIGDCYVHGIMKGEAFSLDKGKDHKIRIMRDIYRNAQDVAVYLVEKLRRLLVIYWTDLGLSKYGPYRKWPLDKCLTPV